MANLKIEFDDSVPSEIEANLSMTVDGDILKISKIFERYAKRNNIRTALQFISGMVAFPTSLANYLDWNVDTVIESVNKFVEELKTKRADDEELGSLFDPPPPRSYGARLDRPLQDNDSNEKA